MTREKEKLAEEVVESRRLLRDMEEQLRVANTESLRLGAEVRKRDKTIAALGEARHSGPDGGRAARVTELETEVETYLSEIARLAKVLAGVHLDDKKAGAKKVSFAAGTGRFRRLLGELIRGAQRGGEGAQGTARVGAEALQVWRGRTEANGGCHLGG